MKSKKVTNKQVLDAYGQSYRLMQQAKRHDDFHKFNKMTKQRTALQELGIWVQSVSKFRGTDAPMVDAQDLLNKIDELHERIEKNQIIGAWESAYWCGQDEANGDGCRIETGIEYFNENYIT